MKNSAVKKAFEIFFYPKKSQEGFQRVIDGFLDSALVRPTILGVHSGTRTRTV